jgi:nitrous oxidase accessory protein
MIRQLLSNVAVRRAAWGRGSGRGRVALAAGTALVAAGVVVGVAAGATRSSVTQVQVAPRVFVGDAPVAPTVSRQSVSSGTTPAPRGSNASDEWTGREIVVGPSAAVRSITEAIGQAAAGDRIRILAGTYHEGMIVVDRRVELVGDGWPVLDADGEGQVLRVTADSVVVRGLTLRGSGISHTRDNAALQFDGVRGCVAENNRVLDSFFGIYLARSQDCRVTGNVVLGSGAREATSGNGIHLWNVQDALIEGNDVRGMRDGLYLEHVSGATLRDNVSEGNLRYGLHFMFSSDNSYVGNTFRNNRAGVAVMYSKNVVIEGNRFEDNWGGSAYGLLLKEISDTRIAGNHFIRNTVGLSSEGSMRVTVVNNRFARNGWAAKVMANSQGNEFRGNDFIDNTFDVTTNSRSNFNTFAGNYWSRYTGYDLDGDGVGDVPFRPVRLFSLMVERAPVALVLLRSVFVDLLDVAERVAPVLTP